MGLFRRKKEAGTEEKSHFYHRFAQQELAGWSPVITAKVVVIYFFVVAAVCVALGVPVLVASLGIVQYSVRYDDQGPMAGFNDQARHNLAAARSARLHERGGAGVTIPVEIQVERDMQPPVYVYYSLHSFYQNHKRYVRSRNDGQLAGKTKDPNVKCQPQQFVGGNASQPINPCGLIAWSLFNDSFSATVAGPAGAQSTPLNLSESGIAWGYDKTHLYGAYRPTNFNSDPAYRGGNMSTVPVNQNEHLMVWMKPAAKPSFRKLWAIIRDPIPAGSVVRIVVQNRFNTYDFGGAKEFVLSTNSWMGGKNLFLGVAYLVVGGLAFLTALAFLVANYTGCFGALRRRKFGDVSVLSWNRK
ncbi:hypothetical protein WJX81_001548 [Elliptochloris bilobata]|uniref:ALA-interacting subunit n=1 Tax=Elliptochloris bilobata TaxID=381761 RepID=A0AAW1QN13_9CHLO